MAYLKLSNQIKAHNSAPTPFVFLPLGWIFFHVTSSPKCPRANGEVERAVHTVKALLRKNEDPYTALVFHPASY